VRIEHVDVRGGVDPRFVRRRFVLAHVTGGALVNALEPEAKRWPPRRSSATRTPVRPPRGHRAIASVRTIDSQVGRAAGTVFELVFDGRSAPPTRPAAADGRAAPRPALLTAC
jgi:hypothetical protein